MLMFWFPQAWVSPLPMMNVTENMMVTSDICPYVTEKKKMQHAKIWPTSAEAQVLKLA